MIKLNKIAMAAAVFAIGASTVTASFAREAGEGARGEGRGHPAIETMGDAVAREAGEGARGEGEGKGRGKGEGKGHPLTDVKGDVVAREAGEGARGEGKGHPAIDSQVDMVA